jgi:hypothetical protein
MLDSFVRFAGWTAYTNAALSIANMVTIMIFFAVGGFWGRLNDTISVFWALSFIPLVVVLYQVNRDDNASLSLATAGIGIGAMLIFAISQSLLALGQVRFEQTLAAVLTMTGVLGLSLLFSSLLARSGETLPTGLFWLTLAYGIGLILGSAGFWLGGQQHPLAMLGFITAAFIGPVWAIWLGRLLLKGDVLTLVDMASGGAL